MHERVSNEEYKKLRERDMEITMELIDAINNSPDPRVGSRDSRPILDIKHMFETSTELYGDHIAFYQKKVKGGPYVGITYKEALADINGLGTALIAGGLKGKRIAVIGANCYEWAISYLAAVCGVGIVVPIDKELSEAEITNILNRADVTCAIFDEKRAEIFKSIKEAGTTNLATLVHMTLPASEGDVLSLRELIEAGKRMVEKGDKSFTEAQIFPDEMSILLFTSGTTGKSKGVMLSHRNVASDIMAAPTVFALTDHEVFFSFLPLHHTYECTCGFLEPLYKGSAIAYCEGIKYMLKNLSECHPTYFLAVPAVFEKLYKKIWQGARKKGKEKTLKKAIRINNKLKKVGIDLSKIFFKDIHELLGGRMKILICGGAAINPEVLDGLRDFGFTALQGYGLTEAAPMGALNPVTAPNSRAVGIPFPGFDAKIVNANEEGIGEICLKGPNIMLGYYEMPEETAAVIEDGWFHTGDLGYMDKDRYVYITGREKNVIITKNGKNIYPEELEYLIGLSGFAAESMVFAKEAEDGEDLITVASILPDEEAIREKLKLDTEGSPELKPEWIRNVIWNEIEKINEELPYYKKIKKLIVRKEPFVKNTSQKIIRFAEANRE